MSSRTLGKVPGIRTERRRGTEAPLVVVLVRVTLKTGETLSVAVSEVRADGLVAVGGRQIAYGGIAALEKRTLSAVKTTLLVVGVTVGAFCLLVVVALFADSGGLPQ